MKPLLIRADGSVEMGTGHVMRCLSLAQAWQDAGGEVTFLMAEATPAIEELLRREGMRIARQAADPGGRADAQNAASLASEVGVNWVVVDGYQFGSVYQRAIQEAGLQALFVDDNGHAEHYCADFVLNQNVYANERLYESREAPTRLLLGPRYAMLRREFGKWRGWKRQIPEIARKVLVTLGGSDPDNVTANVIESLSSVDVERLEVRVVLGGSNPHRARVERTAANLRHPVKCLASIDNMPELMAWADVAVTGAGTTTWELCLLGLPTVLVDLADNQSTLASSLDRLGVARHGGRGKEIACGPFSSMLAELIGAAPLRRQMSQQGQAMVDGYGTARVMAFIDGEIHLRRAEHSDCRQIWEWSNDPDVRAASFSSGTIPWEQHTQWFARQLSDPESVFYVAIDAEGRPVGQVRFRLESGHATISISLSPGSRGHGKGFKILTRATDELFRTTAAECVEAYVKPQNEGSIRLFLQSGFRRMGIEEVCGQSAVHLMFEKRGSRS